MTISNNDLIECIVSDYSVQDMVLEFDIPHYKVVQMLADFKKSVNQPGLPLKHLARYIKANYYLDSVTGNYIKMQLEDETNGGNVCHTTS